MYRAQALLVVSKHIFKGTKKYPKERVKGYKKKYDPSFLDVLKIFTLTTVFERQSFNIMKKNVLPHN